MTLVKLWLAQDAPSSRAKAAELLDRVREFCESTHNTRFLIEALALQAMLYDVEGDEPASLTALDRAIVLAEPGAFGRLFVDMGPSMARLIEKLQRRGTATDYVGRILAVFPDATGSPSQPAPGAAQGLIEPLTPRELEVLALLDQHLTHQEIAVKLVISYGTVKTHTLNIYRKLDVRKRREAVARAKELHLL